MVESHEVDNDNYDNDFSNSVKNWGLLANMMEAISDGAGVYCLWSNHHIPVNHIKNADYRKKMEDLNSKRKAQGKPTVDYITPSRYSKSIMSLYKIAARYPWQNWYMTTNTLKHWHRSTDNVLSLNGIYFDVDCSRSKNANGVTKSEFFIKLSAILSKAHLPQPNALIDSGRGFHLVYLFSERHIVNSERFMKLWQHLERYVGARLEKAIEAVLHVKKGTQVVDPKATDASRVLRVPETNNIKVDANDKVVFERRCRVIYCSKKRYPMQSYWVKNFMPRFKYRNKKRLVKVFRSDRKTKAHVMKKFVKHKLKGSAAQFGYISVHKASDIAGYIKSHRSIGHGREEALFLMATQLAHFCSNSTIKRDVRAYNDMFYQPISDNRIASLAAEIDHLDLTKYLYSTAKIIEMLNLTRKDCKDMKIIKFPDQTYKYHRRHNHRRGVVRRSQSRKRVIIKIRRLHRRGLSQRAIAKKLHISLRRVNRGLKVDRF